MTIVRLPTKPDAATKRLFGLGINIEGQYETEHDGIVLYGFMDKAEGTLGSPAVITVRKNALLVSINPAISEALGYQPPVPTILSEGYFGQLEFDIPSDLTEEQLEAIDNTQYFCKLHIMPVIVEF